MLRRKPGASNPTDPIDLELLEAVDEGVPWRGLLRSASCPPEEAEGRLYRMLLTGVLEGTPGEGVPPAPSQTGRHPVTTASPATGTGVHPREPRAATASAQPSPSATPSTPNAYAAGESLLRELARRSGVSFAPVGTRPSSVPPELRSSEPPRAPSMTPQPAPSSARSSNLYSSAPLPPAPTPSAPAPRSSKPSLSGIAVESPLLALIDELSRGQGIQRWAAARLREALVEELAGHYTQAVAVLQVVMAQVEDPRIRAERDRLQASIKQASSGIHRTRAIDAERSQRHKEALEHWAKVLEAFPQDADAALHAALCAMESGNLKMAGIFGKRAVELAPDSVNAHRILHRFFRKSGMDLSAKREAEIIQKLKKA